jgi:ribonuclease Z
MAGLVDPRLVNDPFGDAGLYLDLRFSKRALLFDLGDVQRLPPRQLRRVSHVFVSHAHIDHFYGFDRLLLVCLGRPMRLELLGPPGFVDRVEHKLSAYTWNLISGNETDFVISAREFEGDLLTAAAEFHTRDAFARRPVVPPPLPKGVVLDEKEFRVRAVTLDHRTPCLAFALEQKLRINVWKDRLQRLGLPVGPWLNDLKAAVRRGDPDETRFTVSWTAKGERSERQTSLGDLKTEILRFAPGEKLAYVVDALYSEENAARIIDLARGADRLFIEAVFLDQDAPIAARKFHLTATQAGALARRAGVKRVVPFHFSARYLGREDEIRREVDRAFAGRASVGMPPPSSP